MQPAVIELRVRDAKGKPAAKRRIKLALAMPEASAPASHPRAQEHAPGVYRAEALFTTAGAWEVRADVLGEGRSQRFTLAVSAR